MRRGRDEWDGGIPFGSELTRAGKRVPHHQSLGKTIGMLGGRKEGIWVGRRLGLTDGGLTDGGGTEKKEARATSAETVRPQAGAAPNLALWQNLQGRNSPSIRGAIVRLNKRDEGTRKTWYFSACVYARMRT